MPTWQALSLAAATAVAVEGAEGFACDEPFFVATLLLLALVTLGSVVDLVVFGRLMRNRSLPCFFCSNCCGVAR